MKGRFINIEINNDSISEIQLIGMASSLIHLYEDSLYQGINKISGDKNKQIIQIGNAVPPPLIEKIIKNLFKIKS